LLHSQNASYQLDIKLWRAGQDESANTYVIEIAL